MSGDVNALTNGQLLVPILSSLSVFLLPVTCPRTDVNMFPLVVKTGAAIDIVEVSVKELFPSTLIDRSQPIYFVH
jgi:hypothetical protein